MSAPALPLSDGPMKLRVNPKRCIVCGICSRVCSESHLGSVDPGYWAINVKKGKRRPMISLCQYCGKCIGVCPHKAIKISSQGNLYIIEDKCDLCGGNPKCIQYCVANVIKAPHPEIENALYSQKMPFLCDLCGGEPKCVEACPKDAISLRPLNNDTYRLLRTTSES